jgi:hypothetical protein
LNSGIPIQRCGICRGTAAEVIVNWDLIPVPSFGNPSKSDVKVATIGLNPAHNEPRLPKLSVYRKNSREDLTDDDLSLCASRCEQYFNTGEESWHEYFRKFESLLGRANHFWSYARNAVHIDLVACVATVRFRLIGDLARESLVRNCRPHLLKTLGELPDGTMLLLDGEVVCDNILSFGKATYDIGPEVILIKPPLVGLRGSVTIDGRKFEFSGWKDLSVGGMGVLDRIDLANWLRGHCL